MPLREVWERTIEREIVLDPRLMVCTPADPFEIDDPCPQNAGAAHQFMPSCGDLVCICGRIAWQ